MVLRHLPVIAAPLRLRTWAAAERRIPPLHPRRAAARIPAPTRVRAARLLRQTPVARAVPRRSPLPLATAAPAARPAFLPAVRFRTSKILISAALRRQAHTPRLGPTPPRLILATRLSPVRTS